MIPAWIVLVMFCGVVLCCVLAVIAITIRIKSLYEFVGLEIDSLSKRCLVLENGAIDRMRTMTDVVETVNRVSQALQDSLTAKDSSSAQIETAIRNGTEALNDALHRLTLIESFIEQVKSDAKKLREANQKQTEAIRAAQARMAR